MRQEAIMQQIMVRPDIEENWQSEEIEKLILSKLENSFHIIPN